MVELVVVMMWTDTVVQRPTRQSVMREPVIGTEINRPIETETEAVIVAEIVPVSEVTKIAASLRSELESLIIHVTERERHSEIAAVTGTGLATSRTRSVNRRRRGTKTGTRSRTGSTADDVMSHVIEEAKIAR